VKRQVSGYLAIKAFGNYGLSVTQVQPRTSSRADAAGLMALLCVYVEYGDSADDLALPVK
jgi:hypothetical protein